MNKQLIYIQYTTTEQSEEIAREKDIQQHKRINYCKITGHTRKVITFFIYL